MGMVGDLARFSVLVEKIYQGALDPHAWREVVVAMADWLDASKAFLHTPMDKGGLFITHGFPPGQLEEYQARYQGRDPWAAAAATRGLFREGLSLLGTDLVPEAELQRLPIYQDALIPYDMPQLLAGIIFASQTPGTLTTVLSMYRGDRQARFDTTDRERLGLVLPHLSRALGVMYRLREAELRSAASLAALDQLGSGILLLAPPGEVVFANRAARRILDANDGLRLKALPGRPQQRLVTEGGNVQAELDAAIRQCVMGDVLDIPHFGKNLLVPRPSGLPPYALNFSALPENNEFGSGIATPRAIVFFGDSAEPLSIAPERLIALYQLTPAEARLAIALTEGHDLQETADRLGISVNTAKTQLQSVYLKTDVDNRAKLTRLLVALAAQRG